MVCDLELIGLTSGCYWSLIWILQADVISSTFVFDGVSLLRNHIQYSYNQVDLSSWHIRSIITGLVRWWRFIASLLPSWVRTLPSVKLLWVNLLSLRLNDALLGFCATEQWHTSTLRSQAFIPFSVWFHRVCKLLIVTFSIIFDHRHKIRVRISDVKQLFSTF